VSRCGRRLGGLCRCAVAAAAAATAAATSSDYRRFLLCSGCSVVPGSRHAHARCSSKADNFMFSSLSHMLGLQG